MAPLRIGLVGVGRMGQHYARLFGDPDGAIVMDPCDPARGLAPAFPGRWDAAVVAAPTRLHAALALPLLQTGIPVLVEKPLAADLEGARALAAHPRCYVGHIERFNPAAAHIPAAPRFVAAERMAEWVDRGIDVDVVLDLMIHDLDLFLHRCPGDAVVDVRASGMRLATAEIDIADARVELASGAVGTFTASRVSRRRARTWRVFAADRAYTSVDLQVAQAVRVDWDGGPREHPLAVAPGNALAAQVEAFAAAVRGGPSGALATAAEGLAALELAWRVRAAIGVA